ncbi:fumarate reductase flavoprotein subunit [Mycobacteroides abscessus]|nr:fumarate reductase flavoprotein subunit [Mycobacteroides abscessus]SKD38560.1 fumarate reductase flavoprotein subunit [Mycobacteroides abscessus subsp. massiliense]CPR75242.1 fumarate reductase flavoprotein subunit [Mycobacteroides abscessus]CPS03378.1 fumarate reductase flavoprotein subunit [Mycobacteroides abscessus]CPS08515.1 fumarate reductase flavoprotein subunit [Mycobacteroides abscessus]
MGVFDLVVVGAGPAGIASALSLAARSPAARIAVLEAGRNLRKRPCPVDRGRRCTGCGGVCNVISGFGGSVHYGDGVKLSLLPSGRRLIDLFGDAAVELCTHAYQLYRPNGPLLGQPQDTGTSSEGFRNGVLRNFGIVPREYPVEVVGETELRRILHRLEQDVEAVAEVLYQARLIDIALTGEEFIVRYRHSECAYGLMHSELRAKNVVLATGRAGLTSTQRILASLGVDMTPPSYSKGVRVEMPYRYLRNIGSKYPDFKFSSTPSRQKTKTFCFCGGENGGRIKFTNYQQEFGAEIITLDGHETLERVAAGVGDGDTLSANFGLLCQQTQLDAEVDRSDRFQTDVIEPYLKMSGGRPIVQILSDFRARRSPSHSWADLIERLPFRPSVADLVTAPAHELFSSAEHDSIMKTFDTLMEPILQEEGINYSRAALDESAIVVAPEVEFMWNLVAVDDSCQTNIRGLFVVGDAAGIAQGVIQATMMGLRSGDAISSYIN